MKKLLIDTFTTKLGNIELSINHDGIDEIYKKDSTIETIDVQIEIRKFNLTKFPISQNLTISDSCGWQIFLVKKNNKSLPLEVECKLVDPKENIDFDFASGEHLDAIKIENTNYLLHVGTEDGDVMRQRGKNMDWFPYRLKDYVSIQNPITEYIKFGFKTNVPELKEGEKLYLHYIVAGSDNLNVEDDVSTWLGVEQSKENINKYGW